jgi:hypothetical protein
MYPRDKYGPYKVTHKWIEAWRGYSYGFVENELREYEDGVVCVHASNVVHIFDHPRMAAIHEVFLIAQDELKSFIR